MRAISDRAPQRTAVARWAIWELPGWVQLFVTAVMLTYAAAVLIAATHSPLRSRDLEMFAVLLAFGITTIELTRRNGEPAGLIKDLHAVWYLPAALLLPPLYGLIAPIPVLLLSQLAHPPNPASTAEPSPRPRSACRWAWRR